MQMLFASTIFLLMTLASVSCLHSLLVLTLQRLPEREFHRSAFRTLAKQELRITGQFA